MCTVLMLLIACLSLQTLVFEVTEDASVPGRDGSCGSGPHDQAIVEAAVAASVDHPNVVCDTLHSFIVTYANAAYSAEHAHIRCCHAGTH